MSERVVLNEVKIRGSQAALELSTHEKVLYVPVETVYRFGLAAGTVLTASQVGQLEIEAERLACRSEATRLLALRQHSVGEVRQKLRRKGFDPEIATEVIGAFKQQGLLDDGWYARTLAEGLLRRKPCGRAFVVAHLQRKSIERTLAEDTADMVLAEQDPEELAARALQRRWVEFSQFELETARRKAYNYLARRGFTHEQARAAFDAMAQQDNNGGYD